VVRLQPDLLNCLDEYRGTQTRAGAIRELIRRHLMPKK
jgi:hypothetical protein